MLNSIEQYLEHYFNLSERIDYFKRGLQYSAEIEVTNQCTMSCRYCYVEAVNDKGISHDPSFVVSLLKQLADYGVREIGWIGGEPLMYNGLEDLMAAAASLGMSNVLYTNGTLLDASRAEWVSRYCAQGRVTIHLDSVKYENFAAGQLKTSPAVHQKVMDSFKNLIAAGYPAERIITTVPLARACYETLRETLQFSYDLGVRFFNLIPLSTLGRSDDLEQSQFINKQELRRAFDVRREILGLDFVDGLGICEYCKQFQLTDFTIAWNGNVYPYIDYYVSAGNVMSGEDIGDILRRNADMMRMTEWVSDDSLANNIRGHCGICEHAAYCFGNPVSKPVVKPGEPDHHCWLVED